MAEHGKSNSLIILQKFEDLLSAKLELCMQMQSLVETSAQSLDAFRTHCSTSKELLIKDEIRMLEGKLIQRIARQLAVRRILTKHFQQLSTDLELSPYLETDLDVFLAQQATTEALRISGSVSSLSTNATPTPPTVLHEGTSESAVACIVDRIRLILDEELSQHPSLHQWLEIVGLMPVCVQAVMKIVHSVEELLQTSESKLKEVIVAVSRHCTCLPTSDSTLSIDQAASIVTADSAMEDSPASMTDSLRIENELQAAANKEKGKLPPQIREDVRRLITACRLLRMYTDRLMAEDNDMRELQLFIPTQTSPAFQNASSLTPALHSSSTVLTPPNSLVRKESVKSLYWDSWRGRPAGGARVATHHTPHSSTVILSNETASPAFCYVHYSSDKHYPARPTILSSFSSEDNFLTSTSQSPYSMPSAMVTQAVNSTTSSHRLTSQSSVMSSVSTATTTGDEADTGSAFADFASASSSCANSVFPSSNNLSQLVQQYERSPALSKKFDARNTSTPEQSMHSSRNPALIFPPSGSEGATFIRPSSSTPSLLLVGHPGQPRFLPGATLISPGSVQYNPAGVEVSRSTRKELLKFQKSSSLESSLRNRLGSDDIPVTIVPPHPPRSGSYVSGSSDSGSSSKLTSAKGLQQQQLNLRRMHHSIHHAFKNHLFLTHCVCAYCEKTLRGVGRKCRHCRARFHPECAEKTPPSCGLPDGLVREYLKTINPEKKDVETSKEKNAKKRKESKAKNVGNLEEESTQVEEDDETLSEFKQRKASLDAEAQRRQSVASKGGELMTADSALKSWTKMRFFGSKQPSTVSTIAEATSTINTRPKLRKQRSRSMGNALDVRRVPTPTIVTSPTMQQLPSSSTTTSASANNPLRSPIVRRISGSFSLPREKRRRKALLSGQSGSPSPKTGSSTNLLSPPLTEKERSTMQRERMFSDPSPVVLGVGQVDETGKRRTVSASSTAEISPPANTSGDSNSIKSSSIGSSPSIPPSPGGLSFNRSGSCSTGPPMSPLVLTSFVNPRTYRSFMRKVGDQIKSHFPWPTHGPHSSHNHAEGGPSHSKHGSLSTPESAGPSTLPRRTPLFGRRKSASGESAKWYDQVDAGNREDDEEESVRLEAEDSFPDREDRPRNFSERSALVGLRKKDEEASGDKDKPLVARRFSLLEPQEEIPIKTATTDATVISQVNPPALKVPKVEVEEDNEPSYSSEVSGDHSGSPIPWRRQQSYYLKELNIPYEQIRFTEKVGRGTFGEVHRGNWHGDVAIKILNDDYLYKGTDELHEAFKQDLATLRKTRHDNLVLFMGACMKQSHDRHQQVIITSLLSRALPTSTASAGASITLHDLIHDLRGKSLSTPYKVQLNRTLIIASQISQGMGYLHRRGIVHKNLKSRNVFVTHEKCVITDYGLFSISKMSQHGRSDDLLWFPKNWLCYLAPELCQKLQTPRQHKLAFQRHRAVHDTRTPFGLPFNVSSDVYAFGTILYELCTGAFPSLWSANNAQRLNTSASTSSMQSGMMTPLSDTPNTPGMLGPPTPISLSSMPMRMPRPADPNLPGSLESALYLISSGTHPIFKLFRSRQLNVAQRSAASTAATPPSSQLGRHLIQTPTLTSPPMSLAIGVSTPPTPVHTPTNLLSPSIEEAAARELTELISVCWSVQPQLRREFPDVYQMLERVPKKNLARSPSHPVHGNAPFPKENMYHH